MATAKLIAVLFALLGVWSEMDALRASCWPGKAHCDSHVDVVAVKNVNASQAFFVSVNDVLFNGTEYAEGKSVKFRASVLGMPDLPPWMSCVYSNAYRNGYIYGVGRTNATVHVQVIATNTETFETASRIMRVNVQEMPVKERAKYEVQMHFSNMDVEDMFAEDRQKRLLDIFEKRLWRGPGTQVVQVPRLYVTLVESAVRMGKRRPVNPEDKEGVIVRVGSTYSFSNHLHNLEMEAMPLRSRVTCPKEFRQTLAERDFRDEGFIANWCGFLLMTVTEAGAEAGTSDDEMSARPVDLSGVGGADFDPPSRDADGRPLLFDFLLCIMLPTLLALVLALALSFIMFGRREGVEKRNRDTPSVQMVQYASIHRASANLRSLAANNRDTTPSSTLPRSYTSSPIGTGSARDALKFGFGFAK